ncbi:MAG: prepilin-type N-terminal cleavage/methylation domain-containing protein [Planctomycetes bacterium]|nr:prepilin-type N-terminal cleavage/methylation domain-containing protein [Planctomycetota bacterium]
MIGIDLESRSRRTGFTLVELLIAMALMVILTSSIVYVFAQAQYLVSSGTAQVEVYQNVRAAFEVMDADLGNTVRTVDMEFFRDSTSDPNGHFDAGAGEDIGGANMRWHEAGMDPYVYAMTLRQGFYDGDRGQRHANDSLYFRTLTTEGATARSLLVTYWLDVMDPVTGAPRERPILKRSVQWFEPNPVPHFSPVQDEDLCYYVTGMRIEWMLRDKRSDSPGDFFTAEEASRGSRRDPANPQTILGDRFCMNILPNAAEGEAMINAYYRFHRSDSAWNERGIVDRGDGDGFGWFRPANSRMQMVSEGDSIYIFGVPDRQPGRPKLEWKFRDLRVRKVVYPSSGNIERIYFDEPLRTGPMGSDTQIEVEYRAAWLPPMVRVTLRLIDERGDQVRTIARVFRILGA